MPALIEFDDEVMIVSDSNKNGRRVDITNTNGKSSNMRRNITSMKQHDSQNKKVMNKFSTHKDGLKKDSYRVIANSIFVDANWIEGLANCPLVLELISSFLELRDLLQHLVYVSKFWQDFVLEKYSERFKEQYVLENELYIYKKFRIDAVTSDFMETPIVGDTLMDDSDNSVKKVKFSVDREGQEIIPPELDYDRNMRRKFLFSEKDTPERYALFVRYTCLDRAREAISKYVNYLLDEYTQSSGNDAKNFRKFIGWNEWNIVERKRFHHSLLEQSKMWYSFSSCLFETEKKLTEMFDMSRDVVILSGSFANFDVEIRIEKSGKTRVVFDDVAQFDEFPMKTMENYNSITWFDEERFVSKQKHSDTNLEMID